MKYLGWIIGIIILFVGYLAFIVFDLITPIVPGRLFIPSEVILENGTSSRAYVEDELLFPVAKDQMNWKKVVSVRGLSQKNTITISADTVLQGTAPGNWFFEGESPVMLEDAQKNTIEMGRAVAQVPWMTTEEIPFIIEIDLTQYAHDAAWLVLERANPSGMPEHQVILRFPIQIAH